MKVGHDVLSHLKALEQSCKDEGLLFDMGSIWLNGKVEGSYPSYGTFENTLPLLESLKEAGFVETETDRSVESYVKVRFNHPELHRYLTVIVRYVPDEQDRLEQLKEKQAQLRKEIQEIEQQIGGVIA